MYGFPLGPKGRPVVDDMFESPCDPNRTKLLGWEGRFEPLLVSGKSVIVVPLKDLSPEDRYMLLVALENGTELPFTIAAGVAHRDVQVNIYSEPDSPEAARAALEEKRKENKALREENRRHREEGISVDHALAALLVNNEVLMTPF